MDGPSRPSSSDTSPAPDASPAAHKASVPAATGAPAAPPTPTRALRRRRRTSDEAHSDGPPPRTSPAVDSTTDPASEHSSVASGSFASMRNQSSDSRASSVPPPLAAFPPPYTPSDELPPGAPPPRWGSAFPDDLDRSAVSTPSSTEALLGSDGDLTPACRQSRGTPRTPDSEAVTPNGTYGGYAPPDPPLAEIRPKGQQGVWADYMGPGGYGVGGIDQYGINDSILAWQGASSAAPPPPPLPKEEFFPSPSLAKEAAVNLPQFVTAARIRSFDTAWDTTNRLLQAGFSPRAPPPSADGTSATSPGSVAPVPAPVVQLDEQTMMTLIPHPRAYFSPSSLEWIVIANAQDFLADQDPFYAQGTTAFAPLYTVERHVSVDPAIQRVPVSSALSLSGASDDSYLRSFTLLTDVSTTELQGMQVYVSEPLAIPSVLARELLLRIRRQRTDNPPPGVEGAVYFDQALRLVLRILAAALGGKQEAVPITGRIFSQRLGWDEDVAQLFATLGWSLSPVSAEDARLAIRPPQLLEQGQPKPAWLLNGRAWVELSLWGAHSRSLFGVTDESPPQAAGALNWLPHGTDGTTSIDATLGYLPHQIDPALLVGPAQNHVLESAQYLGVHPQEQDRTLRAAYLAQVTRLPTAAPVLLTSIEYFVQEQRKDSAFDLQILLSEERSHGRWTLPELDRALASLGMEGHGMDQMEQMDPSVVSALYHDRVQHVVSGDSGQLGFGPSVEDLRHALGVISNALARPDALERQLGRGGGPAEPVLMDIAQAYNLLQAPPEADDPALGMLFEVRTVDDPDRIEQWKSALLSIAHARSSKFLRRLATGEEESPVPGPLALPAPPPVRDDVPAGLNNIGNTCYLNSVLQYFFSVSDIRSRVVEYAHTVREFTAPSQLPRVGGRQIALRELERSHEFILQLASLFENMISLPAPAVTPERELAYLALVSSRAEEQAGVHAPTTQLPALPSASGSRPESNGTDATLVDTTMSSPAAQAAPTAIESERRNSLMQLGAQEDVTECLDNVVFQLECGLGRPQGVDAPVAEAAEEAEKESDAMDTRTEGVVPAPATEPEGQGVPPSHATLLSSLFEGETAQRLQELSSGRSGADTPDPERSSDEGSLSDKDVKKEVFRILPIDVPPIEGRDVYDGLDGFFDEEVIDATPAPNGNESADGEHKKRWIRRSVTMTRAPPILQLQLQRVQFDRTRGRPFKSQAHVEMYEHIYLDRYVHFDPSSDPADAPRLAKRRLARRLRAEAQQLREEATFLRSGQTDQGASTSAAAAAASSSLASAKGAPEVGPLAQSLRETADMLAFWLEHQEDERGSPAPQPSSGDALMAEAGVPTPPPAAAQEGEGLLTDIEVAPTLPQALREEVEALSKRLGEIEARLDEIRRESVGLWAEERRYEYALASLFMHRGEATHGHYFLNQRLLGADQAGETWFKYNDSQVSRVDAKDVLRDPTGANPYLVCYVRKDLQDSQHVMQTLCRHFAPAEAPQEMEQSSKMEQASQEMKEASQEPGLLEENQDKPAPQDVHQPKAEAPEAEVPLSVQTVSEPPTENKDGSADMANQELGRPPVPDPTPTLAVSTVTLANDGAETGN